MIYIRGDFWVCPNALSADTHPFCPYDCKYCFVKTMPKFMKQSKEKNMFGAMLKTVKKFDGIKGEIPVIVGRKTEVFHPSLLDKSLRYISTLKDMGFKVVVETKQTPWVNQLVELVDGVLVSLIPGDRRFIGRLEPKLPTPKERFEFAKDVSSCGIWLGFISEPLLPAYNTDNETLNEYLEKVADTGAEFVNFGSLRFNNVRLMTKRLERAGIDTLQMIQHQKHLWKKIGKSFFEIAHSKGLKVSSPDWVNFGFMNDTEGCCGLDRFGNHHMTYQYAVRLLKQKKRVRIDDVLKKNILPEGYERILMKRWNGGSNYYALDDINNVRSSGYDDKGFKIYEVVEND